MSRFQCPVCLGVYRDPQRHGRYVHVCGPLSVPGAVVAGDLPAVVLDPVAILLAVNATALAQLRTWRETEHRRPAHRDENLGDDVIRTRIVLEV